MGAGLLLAGADRPSTRSSLLETTQARVSPLLPDAARTTSTAEVPARPAGQAVPDTTIGGLFTPGAATETRSAPATASSPDLETGTVAASTGTAADSGPAGAADRVSGNSESPVDAPAAAAAGERARTTVPSTSQATSTPTTRAPEVTTTTTTAAAPVRTGRARDDGTEAEVVPLTNADRAYQGLGTLSRSACLDSIASGYAEQMARSGVLAHNPGAGAAIQGCRPDSTWGDNVGTAAPCDADLLEERWMASPTHRRNILTAAFRLIGVGAWTDEKGGCWVQVLFSS